MKNQTFNPNRFRKFAIMQLAINYKKMLINAGTALGLMLFINSILIYINQGNWFPGHWEFTFILSFFLGGLLYIGRAFPLLRKKGDMMNYYLIPASIFEKFIYEFLEKMGLFFLVFPALFFASGFLASEISINIRNYMGLHNEIAPVSIFHSPGILSPGAFMQIASATFLFFSLTFAGTCVFRKHPGFKIAAIMVAYITISTIFNKYIAAEHSWYSVLIQSMELNSRRLIYSATMIIVAFTAITYAYFRIKEKEVQ